MKSDIAIKVEGVSKKYLIGENKNYPTLRDKLIELPSRIFKGPKKSQEYWALKDVSFEIKKGEVVGIIGRNGAGKSTLLKILARITEPTSGKVTMYGRVASMLEVGTGFNPELTGRENIYLNGAIIGMKKSEITQKFNDIVEFSGVEKFLDTPVKHYSSGMYIRLAFAVAAHLDADILLIDEVLAVGDAEFQKKCLGKMSDMASSGKTVVFVSHNIAAISELCNVSVYLQEGKLIVRGDTEKVLLSYIKKINNNYIGSNDLTSKELRKNSYSRSKFRFTRISILDSKKKINNMIKLSESFSIIIEGSVEGNLNSALLGLSINSQYGFPIFNKFIELQDGSKKRKIKYELEFKKNLFGPGTYSVGLGGNGDGVVDWIPEAINLTVEKLDLGGKSIERSYDGIILYPCNWKK